MGSESVHPAALLRHENDDNPFDLERDEVSLYTLDSTINHPASIRRVRKSSKQANDFKTKGNEFFKNGNFLQAIEMYTSAIEICPEKEECSSNFAIYFCNRAACYQSMRDLKSCIIDCSEAIEFDKRYVKAYKRRAQAYEEQEEYESAMKDLKEAVSIDPSLIDLRFKLEDMEIKHKEKMEKMKDEVFGKLKELGNSFLGMFGMSVDNFQTVQDPNTGGYSINYNPNAGSSR